MTAILRLWTASDSPVIEEVLQVPHHKLSNIHWLVEESDLTLDACTLTGSRVYPVRAEGPVDTLLQEYMPKWVERSPLQRKRSLRREFTDFKKDRYDPTAVLFAFEPTSYITEHALNADKVLTLGEYQDRFYGNAFLSGHMLQIHEREFGSVSDCIVDMFLGHAGTVLAALEYGVQHVVGFEIDDVNYWQSVAKVQSHLSRNREPSQSNIQHTSAHWEYGEGKTIQLYHANSITQGPQIISSLGHDQIDVISDIPWQHVKCRAEGSERITHADDLDTFVTELSAALPSFGSNVTVALPHDWQLGHRQLARVSSLREYSIASYVVN